MQKHALRSFSLVFMLLMLLLNSAGAQEDNRVDPPLIRMLAMVPNTSESRASAIYFNDRAAITESYKEAVMPTFWAEFDAISSSGEDLNSADFGRLLWWRIFKNNSSSFMGNINILRIGHEIEQTVGFDFFDVDRELNYGRAPEMAMLLQGEFDLDHVRNAFSVLGFVNLHTQGAELWCDEAGCEAGFKINPQEINLANPFGGDKGRRQPLVIDDTYLMSSPDMAMVDSHLDTLRETQDSLADVAIYRAGVEALSQFGPLLQAMIFDGEWLQSIQENRASIVSISGVNASRQQTQDAIHKYLEDFQELPRYQLMLFGDAVTDNAHIGMVALVYEDVTNAERAGEIIEKRINDYQSLQMRQPLIEVLANRFISNVQTSIYESSDLAVLVLQFSAQKGTPEEIVEVTAERSDRTRSDVKIIFPGAAYRTLVQSANNLDLGWLSTLTRAELEALLEE